jgi:hypothetical protein
MDTCPCCADVLLRHFDHGSLYWFCRSCWAEMPSVEEYRARMAIAGPEAVKPHLVLTSQSNLVVTPQKQVISGQYSPIAA